MKVLIIGMGSIGRRHLKIISHNLDAEFIYSPSGQIDKNKKSYLNKYNVKVYETLSKAIDAGPNFAIISNPTSYHVETALILAESRIPFIIEKPVSDALVGMNKLLKIIHKYELPVMVGYQMRFHPGYRKMKEIIESGRIGDPLVFNGYVGQYLPDWRPDQDYKKSSSALKKLGGGVILDLSHEIDISISVMGKVKRVNAMWGHHSSLDIETEDVANIIMQHENGRTSQMHLNYIDRDFTWQTRIVGSKGTVIWDYVNGLTILRDNKNKVTKWKDPTGFERDSLYKEQLKRWLKVLDGKAEPEVSLSDGIEVTRVAVKIKRSSNESNQLAL